MKGLKAMKNVPSVQSLRTVGRAFKSQSVMEYLLLLAGVMVLIVLISVLVRGGIFAPASNDIEQNVATIKAFGSALVK